MNLELLPLWTNKGILPAILPGEAGHSHKRAPYHTSILSLIERFGTTEDRLKILDGLVRFRQELYDCGLTVGFQWIDGSFLENVEAADGRSPRDVDVVTFMEVPSEKNPERIATALANEELKKKFMVDGYFLQIGRPLKQSAVRQISYWYSMWSHRRDGTWKGFIEIDLNPSLDLQAKNILAKNGGKNG